MSGYATKAELVNMVKRTVETDYNKLGVTQVNMAALLRDCRIDGDRRYGYRMGLSGEDFKDAIIRHAVLPREKAAMRLTPYDLGTVLEPRLWVLSDGFRAGTQRMERAVDEDYGKVDFEDDEGTTVFTAQVAVVDGVHVLRVTAPLYGTLTVEVEAATSIPRPRALTSDGKLVLDSAEYQAICDVIDRVKTDERNLDTDEYAGMILSNIGAVTL